MDTYSSAMAHFQRFTSLNLPTHARVTFAFFHSCFLPFIEIHRCKLFHAVIAFLSFASLRSGYRQRGFLDDVLEGDFIQLAVEDTIQRSRRKQLQPRNEPGIGMERANTYLPR